MEKIGVLLIDNSALPLSQFQDSLCEAGYNTDYSAGGSTGVSTFDTVKHKIVISSLLDADLSGLKVLTKIKKISPKTPLIIIIEEYNDRIFQAVNEIGIFACLKKPVNSVELILNVRRAVDKIRSDEELENVISEKQELESELSGCQARFSAILDSSPNLILIVDVEDNIVSINNSITAIFGLDADDFIGKPFSDFRTRIADLFDDPDELSRMLYGEPVEITKNTKLNLMNFAVKAIKLNEPEEKYVFAAYSDTSDEDGRIIGRQWNFFDLTESRKSAEFMQAIVDASPIPYIVSKISDGEIIFANEPLAELVGLTADTIVGQNTPDFYADPRDRDDLIRRIKKDGFVRNYEVRIKKTGGEPIWMIFNIVTTEMGGEPVIIGGLYDINERRQAEEALKESEERFRQLTENINAVFWMVEPVEMKMIYISPKIGEILGIPFDGDNIDEVAFMNYVHPEDRPVLENMVLEDIQGERVSEYRIIRPDGEVHWMRDKAFPVKNRFGEIYRICGITEDITDSKVALEALRESEERFRQLTDNINEVFWMTSTDKNEMIYVSHQYEDIWGTDPSLLYNNPEMWQKQLHPDDKDRIIKALPKQILGEYDEEYRVVRPDGTTKWVRDTAFPVKDKDGRVLRICGVAEDITERKNAEIVIAARLRYEKGIAGCSQALLKTPDETKAISKALEHLLTAADAGRVYLFKNFEDDNFGLCARQMIEVCAVGVKSEIDNPLLQQAPYDYGFERGRECLEQGKHYAITKSKMSETELELVEPQGTLSMILLPVAVNNKWYGFIGLDDVEKERVWDEEDIRLLKTAAEMIGGYLSRRSTLEALQISEERFRGMVENAIDIIYSMDASGNLKYLSPQFEKSTGYKLSDAIGNKIDRFMHEEDLPDHLNWLNSGIRKSGKQVGFEFRINDRDGNIRWFSTNSSVIKDGDDNILEIVGVAHDITEMKLVLQELEDANTHLRQTQGQLVQSEKMASLGMLVAGIAHEINTPIGAVNSMHQTLMHALEIMHDKAIDSFGDSYLENPDFSKTYRIIQDANRVINSGTERVTEIVRRLRSFARLDEAELKDADIHEGLEDTLSLIHHEIKHGISIVRKFGDISPISCYPGRLNQVFMNILINARQSMSGKGVITIETYREHENINIRFTDTGIGIPKDKLQKIFDPGFTTKGVGVGTGLGLSICYQIIQDHHGKISVESEEGKGSTFTISIPENLESMITDK